MDHPKRRILLANLEVSFFVGAVDYLALTQGESLNLTISEPGPSTITNVCEAVKCVVLLVSGRPLNLGLMFRKWMLPLLLGLLGLKARELLMCISETMDLQGSCRVLGSRLLISCPGTSVMNNMLFPLGFGLTAGPTNSS
ncbi:hypothetical protein WN943_025805 [Citrus x changshan-huyou]